MTDLTITITIPADDVALLADPPIYFDIGPEGDAVERCWTQIHTAVRAELEAGA